MKTTLYINKITDKQKIIKWLRKYNFELADISKIIESLPYSFIKQEMKGLDFANMIQYESDIKKLNGYLNGESFELIGFNFEDCGFETQTTHEISEIEKNYIHNRIEIIKENQEAFDWFESQPEDIKRKINTITRTSIQG